MDVPFQTGRLSTGSQVCCFSHVAGGDDDSGIGGGDGDGIFLYSASQSGDIGTVFFKELGVCCNTALSEPRMEWRGYHRHMHLPWGVIVNLRGWPESQWAGS